MERGFAAVAGDIGEMNSEIREMKSEIAEVKSAIPASYRSASKYWRPRLRKATGRKCAGKSVCPIADERSLIASSVS